MRNNKQIALILFLLLSVFAVSGCGNLSGKWAYNHDPETVILEFTKNGQAIYKGQTYQCQCSEVFIELKDDKGDITTLRYRKDGNKLYLYEPAVYDYEGEEETTRLPGRWVSGNSSFEFTSQGKFLEDGLFTGIYSIDPDAGTFTLKYNEAFADTTCYFTIENNQMRIEYPWCLVKAK